MLTEKNVAAGYDSGPKFHFKLDGVKKVILGGPITGQSIYTVAGNPDRVETVDGTKVEKNDDEIQLPQNSEFVTKFAAEGSPVLNPEHVIAGPDEVVDPPHAQVMKVKADKTDKTDK